jgi:hypothetical protein
MATVPGTARVRWLPFGDRPERFFDFGRLTVPGFFTPTAPQRPPACVCDRRKVIAD